jgi:hypothetical protein
MELSNVTASMATARASMSHDAFERAAMSLGNRQGEIREAYQANTATRLRVMTERIASGQVLSDEELQIVRDWIVGDADSYLRAENNIQDWMTEYDRLQGVLAEYEGRPLVEVELLELKGILEDAVRVAHDISNHLEKEERVKRFEEMFRDQANLSRDDRQRLAGLLIGKLESPNR